MEGRPWQYVLLAGWGVGDVPLKPKKAGCAGKKSWHFQAVGVCAIKR
jgi:hypothetical protein